MSHKRKLGQTLCFASLRLLLLLLLATVRIDTRSAIKYATIILLRSACCSDCCCCCLQGERGGGGVEFLRSAVILITKNISSLCTQRPHSCFCCYCALFGFYFTCAVLCCCFILRLPLLFFCCFYTPLSLLLCLHSLPLLLLLLVAAAKLFQYTRVLFVFYPP